MFAPHYLNKEECLVNLLLKIMNIHDIVLLKRTDLALKKIFWQYNYILDLWWKLWFCSPLVKKIILQLWCQQMNVLLNHVYSTELQSWTELQRKGRIFFVEPCQCFQILVWCNRISQKCSHFRTHFSVCIFRHK